MTKTKTAAKPAMTCLSIIGRRWFDRKNGNTYHTAEIVVDGVTVHKTERQYGYGEQYLQTATAWLDVNGYLPGLIHQETGGTEPLWSYHTSVCDVARRRDL